MSTQPNNYALIKDTKIFNIILCESAGIEDFSNSLYADNYVLLTEENFFNQDNKPTIDSHYFNEVFYPKSWIKKEDGSMSAPKEYPTDGRVYRWVEESIDWEPLTPFASWIWDEVNKQAVSPVEYPQDGKTYKWDEEYTTWVETVF